MATSPAVCATCQTPLPVEAQFCPHCGTPTPTRISGGGTTTIAQPPDQLEEQRVRLQAALGADYAVERLLGTGGFAAVWAAFDRKLQRQVAVKVLHPELVATRSLVERFQREAQAVAKLRHPGVIPIYAVGEHEGLAFYVMPLVEGESLRARLAREGALAAEEVRRILREAAAALAAAHKAGIVHRDIKPENLMLEGEERRVVLMDFGIAKATPGPGSAAQTGLTGTGMIIGTPTYMSPEQATGSKELDVRSDVYSLGVVGFEMLAGEPPFKADSAPELILQQVATPAPSVAKVRADVPEDLAVVVNRCLMKEPAERWKDAGELSAFLERVSAAPAAKPAPVSKDLRKYTRRHWRPSARQVVWGATVAVVVAVVLAFDLLPRDALDSFGFWAAKTGLARSRPTSLTRATASLSTQQPDNWALRRASVLAMGNSRLAVVDAGNRMSGLHLFDGHSWRSDPTPAPIRGAVPATGDILLFGFGPGASLYRWSAAAVVPVDTLPFPLVGYAWADAGHVVATSEWPGPWLMAVRSAQGWARVASRSRIWLRDIAGTGINDLVVLGSSSPFDSVPGQDSIAEFDGVSWETVDPGTPAGAQRWRYMVVAALNDGAYAIGGGTGRWGAGESVGSWQAAEPLLLIRESRGRWQSVAVGLADKSAAPIIGIFGTRDDLLVWTDCDSCGLGQLRNGAWGEAPQMGRGRVVGVAEVGGTRYVVWGDGTVWARREGRWVYVTEVPGTSVSRAVGVMEPGWTAQLHAGPGRFGFSFCDPGCYPFLTAPGVLPDASGGAAVGRDRAWTLAKTGQLMRLDCTGLGACALSREPVSGAAALVQRRHGGGILVGARGLMLRSDALGKWTQVGVPAAIADESLFAVGESPYGRLAAVGSRHLVLLDSLGAEPRLFPLADTPRATGVLLNDRGAVLLVSDHHVSLVTTAGRLLAQRNMVATISAWLGLSDGRFVVGLAEDPSDPFAGGALVVVDADSSAQGLEHVPINHLRSSVTALRETKNEGLIVYTKSGQYVWPLASLPFAHPGEHAAAALK